MTDQPIAFTPDGRAVYDNTPTVVCVMARTSLGKLITVRRHNEPGKGRIGLPGGYHMRGETWQEAGAREMLEETGYRIKPNLLMLHAFATDEYGNNLVIARYLGSLGEPDGETDGEGEVVLLDHVDHGQYDEWAFPRHYVVAWDFMNPTDG